MPESDSVARAFEKFWQRSSRWRPNTTSFLKGVTGEVAEYVAAQILGLELVPPRTPGYDAIRRPVAVAIIRLASWPWLLLTRFDYPEADHTPGTGETHQRPFLRHYALP